MNKQLSKLIDFVDDFLAYLILVAGIIVSDFYFGKQQEENVVISTGRLISSLITGLLLVSKQEALDTKNNEAARAGRRKNFVMRMVGAFAQGVTWNQVSQIP